MTIQEILDDALQDFKECLEYDWDAIGWENLEDSDIDAELSTFMNSDVIDTAHDVADSNTPIYTIDLLKVALDDISIASDIPEVLCYDGKPTVINILSAVIYERIVEHVCEQEQAVKKEIIDERLDVIISETQDENKK